MTKIVLRKGDSKKLKLELLSNNVIQSLISDLSFLNNFDLTIFKKTKYSIIARKTTTIC